MFTILFGLVLFISLIVITIKLFLLLNFIAFLSIVGAFVAAGIFLIIL